MKKLLSKTLLFIVMLHFASFAYSSGGYPVGSCGYRLVESCGEDSSDTENFQDDSTCPYTEGWAYVATHTMAEMAAEEEPEYPLLTSKSVTELIYTTWGTSDINTKMEKTDSVLSLLLDVSNEITALSKQIDDSHSRLGGSIKDSVKQIQEHEFSDSKRKTDCVFGYADKIIRHLGNQKYTIVC